MLTAFVSNLQQSCSFAIHDSPSEFQALVGDLNALFVVMIKIRDDIIKGPDSALAKHGEQRLMALGNISNALEKSLRKLGGIIDRYKPLTATTVVGHIWRNMQWKVEQPSIERIRVDLGFSLNSLLLVQTSIGK